MLRRSSDGSLVLFSLRREGSNAEVGIISVDDIEQSRSSIGG